MKIYVKAKHDLNPKIFGNTFKEIHDIYLTRFSRSNFKQQRAFFKALEMSYLMCFFSLGVLKYGCAFQCVYVCMYTLCQFMYVDVDVHAFVHTFM